MEVLDGIALRAETEADREFLYRLYASTREQELQQVDWTPEQKALFCRMQFDAQCAHYALHYFEASRQVIERDGVPIGRLYLSRHDDRDIRIVDITLIPEARGAGVGTTLVRDVMDEAARDGKSVSIHVEQFNPALRLYQRLGFRHVDEHGVYYLMRRTPTATSSVMSNEL